MLMIRSRQRGDEVGREDLHVAGEHDQRPPCPVEQRQLARSASALVSGVTGTWWKGMPHGATNGARSAWLPITSAISACRSSARRCQSSSSRQWSSFETKMASRFGMRGPGKAASSMP